MILKPCKGLLAIYIEGSYIGSNCLIIEKTPMLHYILLCHQLVTVGVLDDHPRRLIPKDFTNHCTGRYICSIPVGSSKVQAAL